jgi:hypothetical protein
MRKIRCDSRALLGGSLLIVALLSWPVRLARSPSLKHHRQGNPIPRTAATLNTEMHSKDQERNEQFHVQSFFAQAGKVMGNLSLVSRSRPSSTHGIPQGSCFEDENAIVILGQKKHATYPRDSYGLLLEALSLISKNYLALHDHADNVRIFLFHTGDFNHQDIKILEDTMTKSTTSTSHSSSLLSFNATGMITLVNLNASAYWTLPPWHFKDVQSRWAVSDLFPVGYRHMCRWFGIKIWEFFENLNQQLGCNYRYLLRIDEDSFIHSPIEYDIFQLMKTNQFVYGYRLCAYEMDYNTRYIGPWFQKWHRKTNPNRAITSELCGFYNNFFVADLQFFRSQSVARYLKDIDRQGFIYRKRYGDLMIHTTAVYAFAKPEQVHRFLDFTYQHVTLDHILFPEQECVVWGGIQAGYNDPNADQILNHFFKEHVSDRNCTANVTYLEEQDLSPSYQHVPSNWKGKVKLKTIVAGKVELPNQGLNSG